LTFASFDNPEVEKAIALLAEADKLAVFVGAGISAEAGLPSWTLLVRRLLGHAARRAPHFRTQDQRDAWIDRTMLTELPPGAAGIAQSLLENEAVLARALRAELYRPPDEGAQTLSPHDFSPGPTAHAVAALRAVRDHCVPHSVMKILTTNYDNLLERALRERVDVDADVLPWYWPEPRTKPPRNRIKVHHLHGYVVTRRPQGELILTDNSYHARNTAAESRDDEVRKILSTHSCLFLGSSFSDPNIIKYIFESADSRRARTLGDSTGTPKVAEPPQHVALFTHHSDDPPEVLRTREEVVRTRVADAFTMCVFLDYYADVSQFVYEVAGRIETTTRAHYHVRARSLLEPILRRVVYTKNGAKFNAAQPALNSRLSQILKQVAREVDRQHESDLANEQLAMALWLLDEQGTSISPWVATDRIHRDPRMIQTVELRPRSRWLAARAVCEGKWLGEPRSSEQSRWTYIAGFPLLVANDGQGYVIVGAVTITSQAPSGATWLGHLDRDAEAMISQGLNDRIGSWLLAASKS
jgi:hypothetical protein